MHPNAPWRSRHRARVKVVHGCEQSGNNWQRNRPMTVMFAAPLVRLGLQKKSPEKPGCLKKIWTVEKFDGLQVKRKTPPTGVQMDCNSGCLA